jgi:hypothetical protein
MMQREIVHGVPYFVDGQHNLYTWETDTTPQLIGSYNPKSEDVRYNADHLKKLEGKLELWRSKQEPRARKTKVSNGRGNRTRKVSVAESSDADE